MKEKRPPLKEGELLPKESEADREAFGTELGPMDFAIELIPHLRPRAPPKKQLGKKPKKKA